MSLNEVRRLLKMAKSYRRHRTMCQGKDAETQSNRMIYVHKPLDFNSITSNKNYKRNEKNKLS